MQETQPEINAPPDAGIQRKSPAGFGGASSLQGLKTRDYPACRKPLLAPFRGDHCLQCFEVILRQFHWPLPPAPSPAIAFNAADKTFTVVIDFDQRLVTLFAAT